MGLMVPRCHLVKFKILTPAVLRCIACGSSLTCQVFLRVSRRVKSPRQPRPLAAQSWIPMPGVLAVHRWKGHCDSDPTCTRACIRDSDPAFVGLLLFVYLQGDLLVSQSIIHVM